MAKKHKTWRLIYPDGVESLTNFDPILEERKRNLRVINKWARNIKKTALRTHVDKEMFDEDIKELKKNLMEKE